MHPITTAHRSPFRAMCAHLERNALRSMPALDAAAAPPGERCRRRLPPRTFARRMGAGLPTASRALLFPTARRISSAKVAL
jgi:hypothetical protein